MKEDTDIFIYEGIEVVCTGRTAERKGLRRIDLLHEITPSSEEDGTWKRWVKLDNLYKIIK